MGTVTIVFLGWLQGPGVTLSLFAPSQRGQVTASGPVPVSGRN